ncbi:HNH endonuclease [Streptomyces actuosus]|uniref:HNH endonuclease n=1 Tax=Streptomyces actuosus TaxID=1885 RepID=UPI001EF82479|nr:HNH endonuclease [Streptomyces actuosus]
MVGSKAHEDAADAVARLQPATESPDGYTRDAFKHWNTGLDPADGCNTRAEVLLDEAVEPSAVGPGCRLTGGRWWSYYDATWVTSASGLDIDHMVPPPPRRSLVQRRLTWTPERREAYANDQEAETSLVTVTARSNRIKSDQDPAQWLPPATDAHCRYVAEWVGTKLRWKLTADNAELAALSEAEACPKRTVTYEPAP